MTLGCAIFGLLRLKRREIEGGKILEVGSVDVSGGRRPIVEFHEPGEYVGVDMVSRRGVDVVCNDRDLIWGDTEVIECCPSGATGVFVYSENEGNIDACF